MQRQQIVERSEFTFDERNSVMQKSNEQCSHCGKKIFAGYGGTVDHFIPLSKGGVNRSYNLIPLCKECNEKKNSRIIPPDDYLKYLLPKYKEEVSNYFESYVKSFEYLERRNLLLCDQYEVYIMPEFMSGMPNKQRRKHVAKTAGMAYLLKRADVNDYDRICDYMVRYLKKYDALDDEEAVKRNVAFWYKYGCIYYVEKNDDIKCLSTATVLDFSHSNIAAEPAININVFCYYSGPLHFTLARGITRSVPNFIMKEQNLPSINVRMNVLTNDRVAEAVLDSNVSKEREKDIFIHGYFYMRNRHYKYKTENEDKENEEVVSQFFHKFKNDREDIVSYLRRNENHCIAWMLDECFMRSDEEIERNIIYYKK